MLIPTQESLRKCNQGTYPLCAHPFCAYAPWGFSKVESIRERRGQRIFPESHSLPLIPCQFSASSHVSEMQKFPQKTWTLPLPLVSSRSLPPEMKSMSSYPPALAVSLSFFHLGLMGYSHLSKQACQSPGPKGHEQRPRL